MLSSVLRRPTKLADPLVKFGSCRQSGDEAAEPRRAPFHQLRNVYPEWIVAHLDRLVELEGLVCEMEPQSVEGLRVAVEEFWRLAAHHSVEGGHALLAVEQQPYAAGGDRPVAATVCGHGLRHPYQQATHWMAPVQRLEQAAHLIAIPHITALELR